MKIRFEARCSGCRKPISEAIPGSELGITGDPHKDCGDVLPGAYWSDVSAPILEPKFYFSLLLALVLGAHVANAQAQSVVQGFELWDAANDVLVDADFKDGDHVPYSIKDCAAIKIKVFHPQGDAAFGSIRKQFDGLASTGENSPPMAWEDDGGDATHFDCAPSMSTPGPHRLTVTSFDGPYDSSTGWSGTPGPDKAVNFVTDGPPASCPITGASLECPGHGSGVRCEVPADAQAVSDRQILLRLYINGHFQDYPAVQQQPVGGKVVQDWPLQPTDSVYWGTCTNHLLQPCATNPDGSLVDPNCKQDNVSTPMELGYSYGQPLPEPSFNTGLLIGMFMTYFLFKLNDWSKKR